VFRSLLLFSFLLLFFLLRCLIGFFGDASSKLIMSNRSVTLTNLSRFFFEIDVLYFYGDKSFGHISMTGGVPPEKGSTIVLDTSSLRTI